MLSFLKEFSFHSRLNLNLGINPEVVTCQHSKCDQNDSLESDYQLSKNFKHTHCT